MTTQNSEDTQNNNIPELHIIYPNNNTIFSNDKYVIPLYQRGYAWEEKQIRQLIEDINDIEENESNYYIGSLIVYKKDNVYEVIDGQQRLTSLFILLNWLIKNKEKAKDLKIKLDNLSFECRKKSTTTLEEIQTIVVNDNYKKNDENLYENSILNGIKEFNTILNTPDKDPKWFESFLKKLSKVVLYRIEVPENTDLNRYFEIMNTRGEQLEQHDILKANLIGCIKEKKEQEIFAIIWDACADMTGYVQMHFRNKNINFRNKIFGENWENLPSNNWDYYLKSYDNIKTNENIDQNKDVKTKLEEHKDIEENKYAELSIKNIIENDFFEVADEDGYLDDDTKVRFESIIDFPYFLLHTLKVYVGSTKNKDYQEQLQKQLDDKKLTVAFKEFTPQNNDEKEYFAKKFVLCLLRTRFLFDKFILKREFTNNDNDGDWSIKTLHQSGKRPYYSNTKFEHDKDNYEKFNTLNVMIQSALRVSYTSPKVMHWITEMLFRLNEIFSEQDPNTEQIKSLYKFTEKIVQKAVYKNYIRNNNYYMGVNTPHIVLNYIDYLLWKKPLKDINEKIDYANFKFEFRNSVEHWYPRNPSEGSIEKWDDRIKYNENDTEELNKIDMLGNLCLVQGNINSRFSNMAPEAKKKSFPNMIKQGSLKLQIMSNLTHDECNESSSNYWKNHECEEHHKQMIELLLENCKENEENSKSYVNIE